MIYKYVSIKYVISKVYRDLQLESDESWINMIEWAAEALDHIGAGNQYMSIVKDIEVRQHRAEIPCGLVEILGVRHDGHEMYKLQGIYDTHSSKDKVSEKDRHNSRTHDAFGYTTNDGFINTNFSEGKLELSYRGIKLDDEGFPVIPDNTSFKEALARYITMKLYYPQMLGGKISKDIYKDMQQEWFAYAKQASAEAMSPDLPTMQNIVDEWCQLIPQMSRQRDGFRNLGIPSDSIYVNL